MAVQGVEEEATPFHLRLTETLQRFGFIPRGDVWKKSFCSLSAAMAGCVRDTSI